MATIKAKTDEKNVQYYKVVNPNGHHGLVYHVGLNVDPSPRPLRTVGSCQSGAIYFTDKENLLSFMMYGNMVAWVTPESPVKKDEQGDKWKAHKINITKILPVKEALAIIYGDSYDDLYKAYTICGITISKKILSKLSIKMQYQHHGTKGNLRNFFKENKDNKSLYKYLAEEYKKSSSYNTFEDFEIEFLLLNGYPLDKIHLRDLADAYYTRAAVRNFIKNQIADKTIAKLVNDLLKDY